MIFRHILTELALSQAARFLPGDPEGLSEVFAAIDRLVDDPRPADAFAYGSPDLLRLRVGRYRVLYEIKGEEISITHIGRTVSPESDP